MALQTSGQISLNDIHLEAGGTTGTQAGLNDSDIRDLIGKGSGAQSAFSEFYGASSSMALKAVQTYNDVTSLNSIRTFDVVNMGVSPGDLVIIMKQGAFQGVYQNDAGFSGMADMTLQPFSNVFGDTYQDYSQSPGRIAYSGFWQSGDTNPYEVGNTSQKYGCALVAIFSGTTGSFVYRGSQRTSSDISPRLLDVPATSSACKGVLHGYHCKGGTSSMSIHTTPPPGFTLVANAYHNTSDGWRNQMGLCFKTDEVGTAIAYDDERWSGGSNYRWFQLTSRV